MTARVTGILWIVTFITSIPAFFIFYDSVLNDTDFILGTGFDTDVAIGSLLELILIIANIGTAVVPYAIYKRYSQSLSLGYVTARTMECVFIAVGILSLLTVATLRQDVTDANQEALVLIGETLVAIHDWTFLLGPGFVVGLGNGLILGFLMYRSELVPRRMTYLGLVGGTLLIGAGILVLLDIIEPGSPIQAIATIPEFLWELSLGIYLIAKGFKLNTLISDGSPEGV